VKPYFLPEIFPENRWQSQSILCGCAAFRFAEPAFGCPAAYGLVRRKNRKEPMNRPLLRCPFSSKSTGFASDFELNYPAKSRFLLLDVSTP
jgi:hypothetical protein